MCYDVYIYVQAFIYSLISVYFGTGGTFFFSPGLRAAVKRYRGRAHHYVIIFNTF